jgi:membrane protease subunit (stomatin/prohibitin family)
MSQLIEVIEWLDETGREMVHRFSTDRIEGYLRDVVVARLNDVLGDNLKTVFDLPAQYDDLAERLKKSVRDDFGKYGLTLVDFFIAAIAPPEDVQKAIDERSGLGAIGAGNMGAYVQYRAARALGDAAAAVGQDASGGAVSTGMGLGVGAGLGAMIPGMVRDAMAGGASAATSAGATCPACKAQSPTGAKFCMHCGAKIEAVKSCPQCRGSVPQGATYCPSCGSKQ